MRFLKEKSKASVSGIYITAVRGIRGPLEKPKKKKGLVQEWQKTTARPTNSSRLRENSKAKRKTTKEPKRLSRNNIMI